MKWKIWIKSAQMQSEYGLGPIKRMFWCHDKHMKYTTEIAARKFTCSLTIKAFLPMTHKLNAFGQHRTVQKADCSILFYQFRISVLECMQWCFLICVRIQIIHDQWHICLIFTNFDGFSIVQLLQKGKQPWTELAISHCNKHYCTLSHSDI